MLSKGRIASRTGVQRRRLLSAVALLASLVSCGGLISESASDAAPPDAASDSPSVPTSVADASGLPMDAQPPVADALTVPIDGGAEDASIPDTSFADATPDATTFALPSTSPCLVGGNVLWVNGDPGNHLFSGTQTVSSSGSTWAVSAQDYVALYDGALLEVHLPNTGPADPWWYVYFATTDLNAAMQTGVVYDYGVSPVPDAGEASFMVEYAVGCQYQVGSFRVDDFVAEGDSLSQEDTLISFTAAFVASCEGYPGALRGCIHYGQ